LSWKEKKNVDFVKKITKKTGSWEKLTSGQKQEGAVQHESPKWVSKWKRWTFCPAFHDFLNILWSVTTSGLSTVRKMKEARQQWAGTVVLLSVNK
jgi:hypothetical protein